MYLYIILKYIFYANSHTKIYIICNIPLNYTLHNFKYYFT